MAKSILDWKIKSEMNKRIESMENKGAKSFHNYC